MFAWRVATESLPTKQNKKCTLERDDICTLCGQCTKDADHAVVCCTKARALRSPMCEVWSIPAEEMFVMTGKDWLLMLLNFCSPAIRDKILLLLWRAWHLRNDCIHHQGLAMIEASVSFLQAYWESGTGRH